jgi:murein DD-endopeptidase MepM/ murein hydrolase activator NlpD
MVLIAASAAVYLYFGSPVEPIDELLDSQPDNLPRLAVNQATSVVKTSVVAARAPLEVDAVEPEAANVSNEAELTATFAPDAGESVRMRGSLKKNESVFLALQNRNVDPAKIHAVVSATSKEFDFRKSRPGDDWFAEVDADGNVVAFTYQTSPEDIWETTRDAEGNYTCEKVDVPVQTRIDEAVGTIDSSLWQTLESSGAGPQLAAAFIDLFAYTIDFNSETQPGDQFAIIFERVYLDGEFLRYGKILAARYVGQEEAFDAYYHVDGNGEAGYYDLLGESMKGQFLKSPLATVRITSRYGRRFHPVLGRMKMHAGVDYGAPTGTPVQAVADGKVTYAGWKGANGKLVSIRHANGYVTHYAHLSRINVKRGQRVTKKTVIGKVGSTGRSTGPHLHFGMTHNGRHINPLEVDFARGEPLKGNELELFQSQVVKPMKDKLDVKISLPDEPADTVEL